MSVEDDEISAEIKCISVEFSKSSNRYKQIDNVLSVLPSVIVDIIYSYAQERFFFLSEDSNFKFDHYYELTHILNATNQCIITKGLNIAPNNYYEWYMDYVDNPKNGFMIYTIDQLDKAGLDCYDLIYEIEIPDDARVELYNVRYSDGENEIIYDGYVTNKMICDVEYRINDVHTYGILDLHIPPKIDIL
jgi:hypothetical protein